jgi:hypothetical protein
LQEIFVFIVDTNELQRTLNEIKSRVDSAQTDLDTAKNTPTDSTSEDRFVEAMEVISSIEKRMNK